MSAIAGIFYRDGSAAQETVLSRMAASMALAKEGPVATTRQQAASATFKISGNCGLVFRPSHFTPEDRLERQPLTSRDGNLTLVCAARIDNRPELCKSLGISPREADSMPDSAFILAALEKWGINALEKLIGTFALAVRNNSEGSLLLARSARGEQSLFHWTDGNAVAFSTAPRTLFAGGFLRREIKLERAADFLVTLPYHHNSSWFRDVESLKPGHAQWIRRESVREFVFWKLDPERRLDYARDEDYVDAFNDLWTRVVRDQIRSAGGVTVSLSGGLDSTALAAVAAPALAQQNRKLIAFTEVPPAGFSGTTPAGRYADETPYVQAMARKYPNIDLRLLPPDGSFFLDNLPEYFRSAEAPFRNVFNYGWSEAISNGSAREGASVILTGLAGNLTISWSGQDLMPELVREGRWTRALREARAMTRSGSSSSILGALAPAVQPILPYWIWLAIQRHRHPHNGVFHVTPPWTAFSLIRPEFAREQRLEERALEIGHSFRAHPHPDGRLRTLMRRDRWADYARALDTRCGVELRSPADDQRILEFCLAVPPEQNLRNGIPRWLLRRAMADRVPAEILNNRKRGLQSANWLSQMRGAQGKILETLQCLDNSPLAQHALDLPRLRKLIVNEPEGIGSNDSRRFNSQAMTGLALIAGCFLCWTEGSLP